MQSVSARIWTCVAVSISYDDNHYTTGTSIKKQLLLLSKTILFEGVSLKMSKKKNVPSLIYKHGIHMFYPRAVDYQSLFFYLWQHGVRLEIRADSLHLIQGWMKILVQVRISRRFCQDCEGDQTHWTVQCNAHLILSLVKVFSITWCMTSKPMVLGLLDLLVKILATWVKFLDPSS